MFETRKVDIFVGVLPYSKYLFCYASKDQTRESWLNAIIEMFKFFDGVPKVMMFDNSTTLVTRASRHNPILCQEILDLGRHYDVSVEAVTPGEPTYKGSVENAVKQIQNKILTPLKSMRFFSINEINSILRRELIRLNNLKMRGFEEISRKELFELEYEALQPLPQLEFQYQKPLKRYKVGKNYCIRIRMHNYSLPYRYTGMYVVARVESDNKLRIFDPDSLELIASHYYWGERKSPKGFTHIVEDHRPPNHHSDEKRLQIAQSCIDKTTDFIRLFCSCLLSKMPHSSDNKKANLLFGVLNLKDKYGIDQLNSACSKALQLNHIDYGFLKSLLEQYRQTEADSRVETQEVMDFLYEHGFLRNFSSHKKTTDKVRRQGDCDESKNH